MTLFRLNPFKRFSILVNSSLSLAISGIDINILFYHVTYNNFMDFFHVTFKTSSFSYSQMLDIYIRSFILYMVSEICALSA